MSFPLLGGGCKTFWFLLRAKSEKLGQAKRETIGSSGSKLLKVTESENMDSNQMLDDYFTRLLAKVESSTLDNAGKDENGFFQPTRVFTLQKINMLKDLHRNAKNPQAKAMLKGAWHYVTEHVPAEWLILTPDEKAALKAVLT